MIRYEDISTAIQVRHLQVEVGEALTFELGDRADMAVSEMASRGFDQAPVVDSDRVIGLIRASALRSVGKVAEALEEIHADQLVSADAPVSRALKWLMEAPCLFVLDGRQITGFFLEADLNKQPARTYFYLLVASLEAGLAQRIRAWAAGDEARLLEVMPPRMRKRILGARAEARSEDVDADVVAFFLFSDILRVVGSVPEIRSQLGAPSPRQWHRQTSGLVSLRNAVMHPTRDLVGRERPLARLVELDTLLRNLLRRLENRAADGGVVLR